MAHFVPPLILTLLILISGCTRTTATPADTLVVALSAAPPTLNPLLATDANGMRITSLIFNSLVHLGPDLEPKPEAAESWTYHDRTYSFRLRRDLKFHNGRPLNGEDVQFSIDQYRKPDSVFGPRFDLIETAKVTEQNHQLVVHIRLKHFSDKFLKANLPALKLLPKREVLDPSTDFAHRLIGTGGFRFVSQSSNQIELEGVRAAAHHLIFKIVHDDFTRYQKMLKGEIDIAQMELGPDRVADFQKRPDRFHVDVYHGLSVTYVLINFLDPILQNHSVREALALAIDRAALVHYKLHDLGRLSTSLLTPENKYFNAHLQELPFDLNRAKGQLQSARVMPVELTLKTANSPAAVELGRVLAHEFSQTGAQVSVQSFEWSTFYNDVKTGRFQLATMRWVGTVDPDLYRLAFHSHEVPPGRNRGSYKNSAVDVLLDRAEATEDMTERRQLYDRVQKIVQDDVAILPLWYDEQNAVANVDVLDYHPNVTGDFLPLLEAHKIGQ